MALTFGGATSDRVNLTLISSGNNLNPVSWCFWVYCTTRTSNRFIASKNSTSQKAFRLNGTTGNVEWLVGRATTATSYITNDTPLSTNAWKCFVITYDSTATPTTHIYNGGLTTALTESTYGTSTDGSGTVNSENALIIGNNSGNASAFQGRIACMAMFNVALSQAGAVNWQFRPRMMSGCVLFVPLGFNGTGTQVDYSGNAPSANSVTGATVSDHVPLGPGFGFNAMLPENSPPATGNLFRYPSLSGLGSGGPFFHDPLQAREAWL